MALACVQQEAQRVAQIAVHGVDFGVQAPACDADGLRDADLSGPCQGLMRAAASRIHHNFLHVGQMRALEKALEMAFLHQ